jgi:hypothetical protein
MDKTKLSRLAVSAPQVRVQPVAAADAQKLRAGIAHRFRLDCGDDLTLMKSLQRRLNAVAGPRADEPGFDLGEMLALLEIHPLSEIYINWFRFDDVDAVPLQALRQHFDDFWYPAADDIDIFDATLEWLISIDHEGFVYVARAQHIEAD